MPIRKLLLFFAGSALALLVVELGRGRTSPRDEAFSETWLAEADRVEHLWTAEPEFDWGPDDESFGRRAAARLARLRAA